jgi:hypothetical protein
LEITPLEEFAASRRHFFNDVQYFILVLRPFAPYGVSTIIFHERLEVSKRLLPALQQPH